MKQLFFHATALFLLLSACGASGVGDNAVTLTELLNRVESFESVVPTDTETDEPIPTEFANLPVSGTVQYRGIAVVGVDRVDVIVENDGTAVTIEENNEPLFLALGSTVVEADFTGQKIDATASNFFQIDSLDDILADDVLDPSQLTGTAIDGTLNTVLSQNAPNQNDYRGQLQGTLTDINGVDVVVDLPAGGGFAGTNGEAVFIEAFIERGAPTVSESYEETYGGINALRD